MILEGPLRGKVRDREGLFGQDAKEAFDLVQPGRARWRVMEVDARVVDEPGAHGVGVVRGRVVEHHMEVTVRIGAGHLLHESEEVSCRMAGAEAVSDLAGRDLQGGEQIHDAVSPIVVRVPHGAARA